MTKENSCFIFSRVDYKKSQRNGKSTQAVRKKQENGKLIGADESNEKLEAWHRLQQRNCVNKKIKDNAKGRSKWHRCRSLPYQPDGDQEVKATDSRELAINRKIKSTTEK